MITLAILSFGDNGNPLFTTMAIIFLIYFLKFHEPIKRTVESHANPKDLDENYAGFLLEVFDLEEKKMLIEVQTPDNCISRPECGELWFNKKTIPKEYQKIGMRFKINVFNNGKLDYKIL